MGDRATDLARKTDHLAGLDVRHDADSDLAGAGRTVGRIVAVIKAFDQGEQALTLGNLCQQTNLPKSTVHRLAEQMVAIGWLSRDIAGYRIGIRLFEIGGLSTESISFVKRRSRTSMPWPRTPA